MMRRRCGIGASATFKANDAPLQIGNAIAALAAYRHFAGAEPVVVAAGGLAVFEAF